jgi:ribosomal protein S20
MPITKSAKKALRGSLVKKSANDRNKKAVKEAIKNIEKLVKEKKKDEAKKLLMDLSPRPQRRATTRRILLLAKSLAFLALQNKQKPLV